MTSAPTCPQCNAEMPTTTRFCPECGHRVGTETGPAPIPAVSQVSEAPPATPEERTWAALSHLVAFAGLVFPLGNILAPLVIWIIKRPHSALVDHHGKQALNFQISMAIYFVASLLLIFAVIGFVLAAACIVFWAVMVILATVRASNGEEPGYMLSLKLIK